MDSIRLEVDRKITPTQHMGVVTIGSNEIKSRCEYSDDKDCKVFGFHKTHSPFQRSVMSTDVNKNLRDLWVEYFQASKSVKGVELGKYLPAGTLVLGTINSAPLNKSSKMCIVDGQQRLAQMKAASELVGEDIVATIPAILIEKSSPQELATEYMKRNSQNTMSQKDYVAAAIFEGTINEFMAKLDDSRKRGLLVGCEIGIRPDRKRQVAAKEYFIHKVLTWMFYGLTGKPHKMFILENANYVSQKAIDTMCIFLSEFTSIVGYKEFRAARHQFDCYSSSSYMSALSRLAMTELLPGRITTDELKFWFNVLTDVHVNKESSTLGTAYWEFSKMKNTGGCKTCDEVYASFTRQVSDSQRENGVRSMGIAVARPNQQYKKRYARYGWGFDPDDGRIDAFDEESPLRKELKEEME